MVTTVRAVVCLSLWLVVCQVRGSYIPPKMNRTIYNLLQHYKIPSRERFNGKPVFSRDPLAGKMEAKRVFMGGVLETYEKLIGQMLKQLPTPTPQTAGSNELPGSAAIADGGEVGAGEDVRTQLSYILKKVQELRKHRYQEQEKLLQELRDLKHIQMDNLVVQSKALWELPWLYEEASSLYEIKMERRKRRRRRRQARRVKTRPSA
ncbi:interferon gamma-like isoform X1 [Cyclopterus lumpus]|uniref:interferon gamma-like isoform X1 n=1 Tax=Cyclopterus lumpus TaxID=8103 RepID=UPI0014865AC8|nr:interferon gamma-like isoform X1 [Cyclopterus lumpus]